MVKKGKLISGVIDENAFGAFSTRSILHKICIENGLDKAAIFLDQSTKLAIALITTKGFTIGIDDIDIPKEALSRITEVIVETEDKVQKYIESFHRGELTAQPGKSLKETLESLIMKTLSMARNKAGEIAEEHLGLEKHSVIMTKTGARGSIMDLTQMSACLGQQSIRGERLNRGYRERTLSHFKKNDLSSDARGFIKSSYKGGLKPTEFFFHAVGGREGLVDTAVRTAQSGYMQRRLINALQDCKEEYDGTVRDPTGLIVQFKFGEDNIDPCRSVAGEIDVDGIINDILEET